MDIRDPAVNWLLDTGDLSIRYLTLTEVLGRPSDSKEVLAAKKQIPNGPIVEILLSGQLADGGFGVHPYQKWTGAHWRLVEYQKATGDRECLKPIERASEFFLQHHLFRSDHTGEIIHPSMVKLHYPLYWHCDILQELTILSRAGKLDDPRTKEALDIVQTKRGPDELWHADDYYWNLRRTPLTKSKVLVSNVEIVDWGRKGPNKMITLNALRTLKAAERA